MRALPGWVRWCVIGFVVSLAPLGVLSRATAASTTVPSVAGAWSVYEPKGGVGGTPITDTYTFELTAPNTYKITNAQGFYAPDVAIGADGSATARWTCAGCRGWGIQTFDFNFAVCPATFTSHYQAYLPDGSKEYGVVYGEGTQTGVRCKPKTKFVLSGTVVDRLCFSREKGERCKNEDVPAKDWAVRAAGSRGRYVTRTNRFGRYTFTLRKGSYTVTMQPHSNLIIDPAEQRVRLRGDRSGVDFVRCDERSGNHSGSTHTATDCRLVEVDGTTEDTRGVPIGGVTVTGDGGTTTSDASGGFVLWVNHGPQDIDGEMVVDTPSNGLWWPSRTPPFGRRPVDATHRVEHVLISIDPSLWLANNSPGGVSERVVVAGLTQHTSYRLDAETQNGGGCTRLYNGATGLSWIQPFTWNPATTATVLGAMKPFCNAGYRVQLLITVPGKPGGDPVYDGHGKPVVGYFQSF